LSARATPADALPTDFDSHRAKKPQMAPYLGGFLKTLKDPKWRVPVMSATATDEEAVKAMRFTGMRSMCDAYLDRLIDEDKAENGIEDEYKAKKNKVFMWQARRLFCQQHLRSYAQKDAVNAKLEFMDYVRAVKGQPLPTAAAAAKEKDDDKATAVDDTAADVEMVAADEAAALPDAEGVAAANEASPSDAAVIEDASPAAVPQGGATEISDSSPAAEVVASGSLPAVAEPISTAPAGAEAAEATASDGAVVQPEGSASAVASEATTAPVDLSTAKEEPPPKKAKTA